MGIDDRDDVETRRLADRQGAEGPRGHALRSWRGEAAKLTTCRRD
jgi:hypothetical protein